MKIKRSDQLNNAEYASAIDKGLSRVFDGAPRSWRKWRRKAAATRIAVEARDLKIVVFSDLHRGSGDGADDFRRSHRAYRAALGWYREQGYELWLLGDVEELWENSAAEVLEEYEAVLQLEQEFLGEGPGLRRFYGNHDLDWSKRARVEAVLGSWLGGTSVLESLCLEVREDGEPLGLLFFVHGHQGTPGSDKMAWISRIAVRRVWRGVQRAQGWVATTPAQDSAIRSKHDLAMFAWAKARAQTEAPGQRPVLVAGHTHHPVFPGTLPVVPTETELRMLRDELANAGDSAIRARIAARVELMAAQMWEEPYAVPAIDPPCYFNTGCCSFPDGDVTCLEFSGEMLWDPKMSDKEDGRGKIRLVRWLNNDGEPVPHELAAKSLREILSAVNASDAR